MSTVFDASAFVSTPANVNFDRIPTWIEALCVQVAWADGPPGAPIPSGWLDEATALGFRVIAWAWCQGGDVAGEAHYHALEADGYAGFIANLEEPYDGHGNSSDPKYGMPNRYLSALRDAGYRGPLGLTTTPTFGSDMTGFRDAGAIFMPQAFPLEPNGRDVRGVVSHAIAWGWGTVQTRPLIQAYTINGARPDPQTVVDQAAYDMVGVVPYVVEQAHDDAGVAWLEQVEPAVVYRTAGAAPAPEPEDPMEKIGSQHGIDAAIDRLIKLDPGGSKPDRDPANTSTWGAYDKLRRTLKLLAADYDARAAS